MLFRSLDLGRIIAIMGDEAKAGKSFVYHFDQLEANAARTPVLERAPVRPRLESREAIPTAYLGPRL